MDSVQACHLFQRLREARPKPTTELRYLSPFELLVAVILSAQSTDKKVNEATEQLFRAANTPRAMLALGETTLRDYIKTIGLYNLKARNLMKTCALLLDRHGGEVPADRDALQSLPGVGRKTANVLLNTAFGQPTIAVDTHIFRVANRTGLAPGKTVQQVEAGLLAVTPDEFKQDAHHWLILHGRYVCTARKPKCPDCPIRALCAYPAKVEAS
ncbi:MAG: endonuclease III [Candidatus Competibacter sp.]|nr:endonuclease III [Candidatus Competibacter sp.]